MYRTPTSSNFTYLGEHFAPTDHLLHKLVLAAFSVGLILTCGTAVVNTHAEERQAPASNQPPPALVASLLESLGEGSTIALSTARTLTEQQEAESLVTQAVRQIEAEWEAGQSEAWTSNAISILEQWSAKHAVAGKLLIRLLEDERVPIRQAALQAATKAGVVSNPRILPLIANLRYAEPQERYRAASFLGKFGEQAAPAVGALVRAAQDDTSHAALRWEAVFALRDIGPAGIPGLIDVLNTTDRSVAYKALDSLQSLGAKAEPAYEAVVEKLSADDPHIRQRAATVLGQFPSQSRQSIPHIEPLLNDPDQHVRDAATETLKRLQQSAAGSAVRRPPPDIE